MMPDAVLQADWWLRDLIAGQRFAALDAAAVAIAYVGQALLWLVPGIGAALLRPSRWPGVWQLGLALLVAWQLNVGVLKPLFGRDRPYVTDSSVRVVGDRPASAAFPSGHSATAFAGALALARVIPQARVAIWAAAVLVAWSRVYTGVHFPLDVLAGALVGLACGWFVLGGRDGPRRWD